MRPDGKLCRYLVPALRDDVGEHAVEADDAERERNSAKVAQRPNCMAMVPP